MGRFTGLVDQLEPTPTQTPVLDPFADVRMRNADPDAAAEAQRLSAATGLPQVAVANNLDEIKQRETAARFRTFLRDTPEAQTLGDDFNTVAKDDIGILSRLAAAIKSGSLGAGAGLLNTVGAVGERLQARFPLPGIIQDDDGKVRIVGGVEYNKIVAERRARGEISDASEFLQFAGEHGARRAGAAGEAAAIPELGEIDSAGKFLEFGALHAAQSLPYMLLARSSPTLVAGSIGGNVLQERTNVTGEAPTDQDVLIAMSAGVISGALEKYGADKVLGAIPQLATSAVRRVGTATLAEAATEFLQEGFVEYTGEVLGISEFDFDAALYRGATGALAGGFTGASVRTAAETFTEVATRITKERVEGNEALLKEIGSLAEASALKERSPEQFKRYMETVAPDTDIYFDAEDAESLMQSSEADLPDDLEERIAEAAETDVPVRISAAEYATYFADSHTAQNLTARARVGSATAMNAEEAKNIESEFQARADLAISESENAELARQDARQIGEQVLAQIQSTGRFRSDVATAYSSLVENFYVTMAARTGMTAGQLFEQYPLRVQATSLTDADTLDQPADYSVQSTERGRHTEFKIGDVRYVARLDDPNPMSYFSTQLATEVGQLYGSEKPALELDFGAAKQDEHLGVGFDFEGRVAAPNVAKLNATLMDFAAKELERAKDRVVMVRAPLDSQNRRLRIYERALRRLRTHDVQRMDDETIVLVPRAQERAEPELNQQALQPVAARAAEAGELPSGFTRFRHFGNLDVPVIDPEFMGTGMRGEESRRAGPRVTSLYPDTGFQKESGVGNIEYVVDVPSDQVYDASADPLGLADDARETVSYTVNENGDFVPAETRFDMDKFEEAVKAAGYAGYTTPGAEGNLRGQARLFNAVPVIGAQKSIVEETADLFQLAPENEPAGFDMVAPYLTEAERAKLQKNTARKLVDVFKSLPKDADFAAAAQAGAAKRGWYATATRTLRQVFGDTDAPRFAALLAATSPQIGVQGNLANSAAIWKLWDEKGRPTTKNEINLVLDEALGGAQSVLNAWRNNAVRALSAEDPYTVTLSGPKVNSFMRNLMGDTQEVTNDTWMANFALVSQTIFNNGGVKPNKPAGKTAGYLAYNAKIRKAAKTLGWTPAEVQETIWSWAKTALELADVAGETRSVEDLVRAGEITDARVAGASDFASMLKNNESIRSILEAAGYGDAIKAVEAEFGRAADGDSKRAAITPALLRSARRLDEVRRQRGEASAGRGRAEQQAPEGQDASTAPLSGLPDSSQGPIPAIKEAAQQYVADVLINKPQFVEHTRYVPVNEKRGRLIAAAYDAAKHDPNDFETAVAYDALIDETLAQFQVVKQLGLNIEFIQPGQANPYSEGPRQVHDDLRRGHLWVFPTDQGFGQTEAPNHPLLRPTEEVIGDRVLLANDVFRIVHDVFGHGKEGVGFGPSGEDNAWHSHVRMYSPLAAKAMTTETRGQNSWVNFGPHGDANRTNQKATVYAEQKATLLPEDIVFDGIEEGGAPELMQPNIYKPGSKGDKLYRAAGILVEADATQPGNPAARKRDIAAAKREVSSLQAVDAPKALAAAKARLEKLESGHALSLEAESMQQEARGKIRLGYDLQAQPSLITLLEGADLSTFLHESGHFFFEVMADLAARPDAPAAIRADMETLLKWVKFSGTVEEWRAKSVPERREAHEQFARGFEAWLMEGNAPNEELRGLFHRFRAWLVNIYKKIERLNVGLTDEVRSVMGGMVATEQQIKDAEAARSYMPLFESQQAAGMTPEEWQAYQDTSRAATERAQDALQARSMRNLRWLDNARSRELRKLQKANAEKRAAVQAEVEQEIAQQPVRVAETLLLDGTAWVENIVDGTPEQVKLPGPHKLSVEALEEAYGTREEHREMLKAAGVGESQARAPWEYLPRALMSKDGNLSADEVAEMTGFTSGDQLINALVAMPNRETLVRQMTDERMMQRYGDLNNPQAMAYAVDQAVHNQHRTRVVATELQALDESLKTQPGGIATVRRAARDFAAKVVQRQKIREVRPNQYLAAETKAARDSRAALASGDLKLAAARKRDQLFNGYASRDANRALELVDKGLRYLKRFNETSTRKSLDPSYRDQIDKMLERYDLRRRSLTEVDKRSSLAEWIKEQEAQGNEPIIAEELADESRKTNYQNLSVEQFAGLVDAIKNIEHLARLKSKLLAAKDQRDFDTAVTELVDSIDANAPTGPSKVQLEKDLSLWGRFTDTLHAWLTHLRKFSSVARQIDGGQDGGKFWSYMIRPLNTAADKEVAMRSAATKKLNKLLDQLPALQKSFAQRIGHKVKGPPKVYVPVIGKSLTLEARLAVALNWGNEGNRERIREGNQWTDAQAQAVIDTLTKDELDFVQSIFDFIGSYWSEIADKEERVTGVRPTRVESVPINTQYGEYAGGYYPIVADPGRSEKAAQQNDAELIAQSLRGAVSRATTRRGHTKARVGGKDPVRLDLGVIAQHVGQVIHDLSWHETLIDAGRLLRDKRVSGALRDKYGAEITRLMRKTLDDVARGEVVAQDAGERVANYFRVGSTIAGLGLSVTTSLLQFTGITQSFVRVGYRDVGRGLVEFMARPAASIKKVREASTFMRDRGLVLNRELGEITNRLDGEALGLARFYFMPIQAAQVAIDVPTWLGAYGKAERAGETNERAIALADQAVRDSQSTGMLHDLAETQRGGAWKKLWTNFYSYFSATYQLSAESVQGFKRDPSILSGMKLASDFFMLYTVPAVLGVLIREGLRGDLDDKEPEELAEALLKAQLSTMLGIFPYFRELGGIIEGFDYRGPAGANILAQLGDASKQLAQGENDEALWRALNRAAGTAFHYPAAQVDRTVRGMIAVAEGDAGPQAILVGPPKKKD